MMGNDAVNLPRACKTRPHIGPCPPLPLRPEKKKRQGQNPRLFTKAMHAKTPRAELREISAARPYARRGSTGYAAFFFASLAGLPRKIEAPA